MKTIFWGITVAVYFTLAGSSVFAGEMASKDAMPQSTMQASESHPTNSMMAKPETNSMMAKPETNSMMAKPETNSMMAKPETNSMMAKPETNSMMAKP